MVTRGMKPSASRVKRSDSRVFGGVVVCTVASQPQGPAFDSRVGQVESCKWASQRRQTGSLVAQCMHHIVTCIPQCIKGLNFLRRERKRGWGQRKQLKVFHRPDHLIEQRSVPALPAHEEDPVLVRCQDRVLFVGLQPLNCGVSMFCSAFPHSQQHVPQVDTQSVSPTRTTDEDLGLVPGRWMGQMRTGVKLSPRCGRVSCVQSRPNIVRVACRVGTWPTCGGASPGEPSP